MQIPPRRTGESQYKTKGRRAKTSAMGGKSESTTGDIAENIGEIEHG